MTTTTTEPVAATRSVTVRAVRAGNRAYLSAAHLEAVFGAGHRPVPCWAGLLAEPLCLERVGVVGGNRREARARVVAVATPVSRLALTAQALQQLDLRVPARGPGPGAALSGPRGTVVLADGVSRAAPRILLPEGVARRLSLVPGAAYALEVSSWAEALGGPVTLECPAGLRDAVVVLDGAVQDRLGGPGATVTARLTPVDGA
ncbi:MAG: hypothetical protein HY904_24295 [Deltaproteobacteria bacterium]|nr:hypothetical protein [Deltaproteobacteria bacterium]